MVSVRLLAIAASVLVTYAVEQEDNIAAALAQDSEACEADSSSEECSLELRQLRAGIKLHTQADAAEGDEDSLRHQDFDNEVGEEGEPVQGDEEGVQLIQQEGTEEKASKAWPPWPPRHQGNCQRNTQRQCGYLNNCPDSLGRTHCVEGTCRCQKEHCFRDGYCMHISASKPLSATCQADTSGTCSFFGCDGSRGPTECKDGRCLCKDGTCAVNGQCMPNADTGVRCGPFGGCPSLPNTVCIHRRCVCKGQLVAVRGRCMTKQQAFHNPYGSNPFR